MSLTGKQKGYVISGGLLLLIGGYILPGLLGVFSMIVIGALWVAFAVKSSQLESLPEEDSNTSGQIISFGWLEAGTSWLAENLRSKIRQAFSWIFWKVEAMIEWGLNRTEHLMNSYKERKEKREVSSRNPEVPFEQNIEQADTSLPIANTHQPISSMSNQPQKKSKGPLGLLIGIIAGIPVSYLFQPKPLQNKLSMGDYITHLPDLIERVAKNPDESRILITLVVSCVICGMIGIAVAKRI